MIAGSLLCLGWYMGFKVKKEYPEVNGKGGEPLSVFHGVLNFSSNIRAKTE
jgi:hypothetical protein